MNLEQARFNMIEQQIRPWEVLDPTVLALLNQVAREDFVPERYQGLAFADLEIPLGHGQSMLSPKLEARMLQSLALQKTDKVLEVGTGSGYMTALLAALAGEVTTVERLEALSTPARQKLLHRGVCNVTFAIGNAAQGWPMDAPYDAIILTGSVPMLAETFKQQLKPGGRLLAVIGEAPVMQATLVTCVSPGIYRTDHLFETCIPALDDTQQPEKFVF